MVYIYSQTAEFSSSSSSLHSQTSSSTEQANYILSFYVPAAETTKVAGRVCRQSGAGTFSSGLDTEAYWTCRGVGQFRAIDGPNGGVEGMGRVEKVEENKVEIMCKGRQCAEKAVKALIKAHPYEQVPYYVVKTEVF